MVGTRGAPAHYGGFETAVEEIGVRLADRGHQVRVYCRTGNSDVTGTYRGMELVYYQGHGGLLLYCYDCNWYVLSLWIC